MLTYIAYVFLFILIDRTDEYQLITFMLSFKATLFFSSGIVGVIAGYVQYARCVIEPIDKDDHDCEVSGPGNNWTFWVSFAGFAIQAILVWLSYFCYLPSSHERGRRRLKSGHFKMSREHSEANHHPGGYLGRFIKLDLISAFACFTITVIMVVLRGGVLKDEDKGTEDKLQDARRALLDDWVVRHVIYTMQCVYSLSCAPFFVLALPVCQAILTHCVPSAYNGEGVCTRYVGPTKQSSNPFSDDEDAFAVAQKDVDKLFKQLKALVCQRPSESGATVLQVRVLCARNLRNADVGMLTGVSDPYVIVRLQGKPESEVQTSVVMDSLNPTWKQNFTLQEYELGDSVVFEVWDYDKGKKDEFLGRAVLDHGQITADGWGPDTLPLLDAGKGDATITVQVDLPARTPIKVFIERAQNLKNADSGPFQGVSDPFVTCEIKGKPHTKVQTPVIDDCLNPIWDFEGAIVDYEQGDELFFTVLDKDIGRNDCLGFVLLRKDQIKNNTFSGPLHLADAGKDNATLTVRIEPNVPAIV